MSSFSETAPVPKLFQKSKFWPVQAYIWCFRVNSQMNSEMPANHLYYGPHKYMNMGYIGRWMWGRSQQTFWGWFTTAVLIIKNDVISEVLYEFEFQYKKRTCKMTDFNQLPR